MTWVVSGYTVLMAVATVLPAVAAVLVWRERPKAGATWLAGSAALTALWALGQLVLVSQSGGGLVQWGNRVSMAAAAFQPPLVVLFALGYTGHLERVPRVARGLLVSPAVALVGLGALGHPLVRHWITFATGERGAALLFESGFVLAVYAWGFGLLAVAIALIGRKFLASRNVFRRRSFFFVIMIAVPGGAHLLTVLGASPTPGYTLMPVANLGVAALSVVIIQRSDALSVVPVRWLLAPVSSRSKTLAPLARDRAIEEMDTGFLVVDHEGRIVDINPIGKRMLGRMDSRIVGKQISSVAPHEEFIDEPPEFITADPDQPLEGSIRGLWMEPPDGEKRCFDVLVTPLAEGGETVGNVVLMHDVTERERNKRELEERTRELERQNDQLEDFASIVSHDLRNPLTVASGNLAMVDAGEDQDRVEAARDALARMEELIDDVLAFVQMGKTVTDVEPVGIAHVARDAWENVDTAAATLSVDADVVVDASPGRLGQVFENLFRNAVEHGRSDVTVTIDAVEDGFVVADDGPGFPEGDHDRVLEEGFSTETDGTGLGLAIVRTIVEAHGWTLAVGESDAGGARVEVTGVHSTGEVTPERA